MQFRGNTSNIYIFIYILITKFLNFFFICFKFFIVFFQNNPLCQNFFPVYILIMAFGSLSCRRNDGLWELVIFLHAIG